MTVVIKKVDLCIQMPARAALAGTTNDTKKVPDPDLLFQKALASVSALGSSTNIEDVFSHELYPYLLSILVESGMMRFAKKLELVDIVKRSLSPKTDGLFLEVDETMIDGGALLHRVTWRGTSKELSTVSDIIKDYMSMVFANGGSPPNVTVVFDGYESEAQSTKQHFHLRRNSIVGLQLSITTSSKMTATKKTFLSNPVNKQAFVDILADHFRQGGHERYSAKIKLI